MIIDALVFFAFVLIVLVVGGAIALADLSRRRKRGLAPTDNVNDVKQLSFPQRNWLLLCVIVAILSPLLVSGIDAVVHKKRYSETVQQDRSTGQNNNQVKDTSYHVATPPVH